jgi:cytochrome subunit of sulfide dehydrogenase
MSLSRHSLPFVLCAALLGAGGAMAQTPSQTLKLRSLAATCANCHGTDGRAVAGSGSAPLHGLDRTYFIEQMTAFRDGKRQATVMHQLAKGYSPRQIEQLAGYFEAQK